DRPGKLVQRDHRDVRCHLAVGPVHEPCTPGVAQGRGRLPEISCDAPLAVAAEVDGSLAAVDSALVASETEEVGSGERELQRVELPTRGELPEERRMVCDVRGDNLDADGAKLRLHELKTSRSLPQTGEGREAQRQTVSRADIDAVRAEPAARALEEMSCQS